MMPTPPTTRGMDATNPEQDGHDLAGFFGRLDDLTEVADTEVVDVVGPQPVVRCRILVT